MQGNCTDAKDPHDSVVALLWNQRGDCVTGLKSQCVLFVGEAFLELSVGPDANLWLSDLYVHTGNNASSSGQDPLFKVQQGNLWLTSMILVGDKQSSRAVDVKSRSHVYAHGAQPPCLCSSARHLVGSSSQSTAYCMCSGSGAGKLRSIATSKIHEQADCTADSFLGLSSSVCSIASDRFVCGMVPE